jgi:hypothetical protein
VKKKKNEEEEEEEEEEMHRFVTTKQGHVQLAVHFRELQNCKDSWT